MIEREVVGTAGRGTEATLCVPSCCRPHFMGAETRPSEVSGLPELTRPVVGRDINLDLKDSGSVLFPRRHEAR